MAKTWTCPNCKYEWPVSVVEGKNKAALPETAACPRCGEEVAAIAAQLTIARRSVTESEG